uniref:Uncharacterized protein n=1 Tax=Daphnia magna TaxID=35525 RepID=A0A0P6F5F3_9CRUS
MRSDQFGCECSTSSALGWMSLNCHFQRSSVRWFTDLICVFFDLKTKTCGTFPYSQ